MLCSISFLYNLLYIVSNRITSIGQVLHNGVCMCTREPPIYGLWLMRRRLSEMRMRATARQSSLSMTMPRLPGFALHRLVTGWIVELIRPRHICVLAAYRAIFRNPDPIVPRKWATGNSWARKTPTNSKLYTFNNPGFQASILTCRRCCRGTYCV